MLHNSSDKREPIDVRQVALKARDWARQLLVKSATSLAANDLTPEHRNMLGEAIVGVRSYIDLTTKNILLAIDDDDAIAEFELKIHSSAKYSIGNCYEYALLALDYVAMYAPEVDAEAYEIMYGDHNFLVLGRTPNSDPANPYTWGDNAYICDPWANKVYKARDYLTELKNFTYEQTSDRQINYIEPFNPIKHKLRALNYNTKLLRKRETYAYKMILLDNYYARLQSFELALEKLQAELIEANDRCLDTKIERIRFLLAKIKAELTPVAKARDCNDTKYIPYRKLKANLQSTLRKIARASEAFVPTEQESPTNQTAAHLQFFKPAPVSKSTVATAAKPHWNNQP